MGKFYRFVKALAAVVVKLFFKLEVNGGFTDKTGYILCCNHQSFWDMVLLIVLCPNQIHFMGKKELFSNKILAFLLHKLGAFAVNRGSGDVSAVKTAIGTVTEGGILGIFPEGTRYPVGRPSKFRAGAAMVAVKSGADILPVAIRYDKKARPFRKVLVNVGEILPFESFCIDSENAGKSDIKRVLSVISNNIINLWEKAN